MAVVVTPDKLAEVLTERIQRKLRALNPKDPRFAQVLMRIGQSIEGEAKLNIKRSGNPPPLIDTGRLFNSIRHFVEIKQGKAILTVGSFAVPYAAVHEFGFNGVVNVQSYTRSGTVVRSHTRQRRGGGTSTVREHNRGTATVRAHARAMSIQGWHYLEKATDKTASKVPRMIGQIFRRAK